MSEPTYTCLRCYRSVEVTPGGHGFPPDIAKRKLMKLCAANDCPCDPQYTAGVSPDLMRQMEERDGR